MLEILVIAYLTVGYLYWLNWLRHPASISTDWVDALVVFQLLVFSWAALKIYIHIRERAAATVLWSYEAAIQEN